MNRAISVTAMITVDRLAIEQYGVVLLQMMENAGRGLAALARHYLDGSVAGRRVVVLVGKGNNGGGGLVAARHLANAGAEVAVALTTSPDDLGEVPGHQQRTLARMGIAGSGVATPLDDLSPLLDDADVVLDALVGYSLRGAPREPMASFIRQANTVLTPRLALDIPSGLDGDSGQPFGPCVQADATLTLAWPKAGVLAPMALPYTGALYLADIGIPAPVYRHVGVEPGSLFARGPLVRIRPRNGGWEPASRVETDR